MNQAVQIEEEGPTLSQEEQVAVRIHARLLQLDGLGVGFAGATCTGKTTLAQIMARDNPGIPFVETSTKEIVKAHGFDMNANNQFASRLDFQEAVLDHYEGVFSQQNACYFTDRTPVDFAAYLLADIPAGPIDPALDNRVQTYLKRCAAMIDRHFMTIVIVQPGIPYVPVEGRPAPNRAYQEKININAIGFARSYMTKRRFYVLDRGLTDLGERASYVAAAITTDLRDYRAMMNWLPRQ